MYNNLKSAKLEQVDKYGIKSEVKTILSILIRGVK